MQVIAGAGGTIVWTSGAMPGSVHDVAAARLWGVPHALAAADCPSWPQEVSGRGRGLDPCRGCGKPASEKQTNRSHAKLLAPGERVMAQLKTWRTLHKIRCGPVKTGHLVKAIAVLQNHESIRG